MELVVELLTVPLSSDYRSSAATFRVPFDEALEVDCDLVGFDSFAAAIPWPTDVDLHSMNDALQSLHAGFVAPDEIVELEFVDLRGLAAGT